MLLFLGFGSIENTLRNKLFYFLLLNSGFTGSKYQPYEYVEIDRIRVVHFHVLALRPPLFITFMIALEIYC